MEDSPEKAGMNNDESRTDDSTAEIAPVETSRVVPTQAEGSGSPKPDMLTENMDEIVSELTDGFLSEVQPQLLELREKTKEITKNQKILIETIEQENKKYNENKEMEELNKMVSVVQSYYTKLKKIKNDMDHLDERVNKLKKRSLKLKEKRQKKEEDEAQRRERELVLERELTAKPARS